MCSNSLRKQSQVQTTTHLTIDLSAYILTVKDDSSNLL